MSTTRMRRPLMISASVLTVALAALAVAVGAQTGPTQTLAQARTALAAGAAAPDVACHWFGIAAAPVNGKVSPQVRLPDGNVVHGPCVWPDGRRPTP